MLLKTALGRKINRMIFKCRLSLTSPTKQAAGRHGAGHGPAVSGGYGYARRPSSAARADNAYLLAVFFVLFLLVMIVTQVMVMRSEWSATAGKSSAWRSGQAAGERRPASGRALRFGRQPAPFGRALAADKGPANALADARAASPDLMRDPPPPLGRWLERLPQEQGRDAWVDELWPCFRAPHRCPWQPVAGPDKCFVYSAYHDDSREAASGPLVRVVGVARTKKQGRLWCQLGFASPGNDTLRWHSVPAQVKTIREHWNLRYSAAFILCPLREVRGARPDFVSVSSEQRPALADYAWPRATATRDEFNASYGHWSASPTGNILPVVASRSPSSPAEHELTVCVKPLHYNFDRAGQLVEFIEMHRLLGVSHFTFYNHTVGERVDCLLRRYADEGLVDVLPWRQLDVASQKEIRTEGIFASLNDCLYRHMFDSQYLLMIDLDELVVPRRHRTLVQMIDSTLNMTSSSRVGAYYFRNAFFYLSWPDDAEAPRQDGDEAFELTSLKKTRRNVKLHPHRYTFEWAIVYRCLT